MKKLLLLFVIVFIGCSEKEVIPTPTVSFTAKKQAEGKIEFNISTANADSFIWDFGDGGTSTDRIPVHTYQKNGKYNITLSAKGKGGQVVETGQINVDNITGSVIFWMQSMKNKNISVKLAGKVSNITAYYIEGTPSCGAAGSANFSTLPEGVYEFEASELNALFPTVWKGKVSVIGRECQKSKLQY